MREAFPSLPFDTIDATKEKETAAINWVGGEASTTTTSGGTSAGNSASHQKTKSGTTIGYTIQEATTCCTPDYATTSISSSCTTAATNNNHQQQHQLQHITSTGISIASEAAISSLSLAHQQTRVQSHDASKESGTVAVDTTTATANAVAAFLPHLPFSGELEELRNILHFPEEVALRLTDSEYQLFCQVSEIHDTYD